jgi:tryptophan synthase alpha chain
VKSREGRIGRKFADLRRRNEAAFIPFLNFGDPEPALTLRLLREIERAGADLVEIGIPFSDPMADGPVLQRSAERALGAGATLRGALDVVTEFRRESELPVILFGYYNPLFRYGVEKIAADARAAGADGFLCVDLPPDEARDLDRAARANGLDLIYLLAPTSTPERLRVVLSKARGFVYFVSVLGVTGVRSSLPENLEGLVSGVRRETQLPIGIGFGISTPEQAGRVAAFADAVIVGSAFARILEESPAADVVQRVGLFASTMKEAIRRARAERKSA